MPEKAILPEMSAQTEFGKLESRGNLIHVEVVNPSKHVTFEGPNALLKSMACFAWLVAMLIRRMRSVMPM